ncbi:MULTISPECIES: hypothetical protein [unclassified Streptomyces]|nr:MULTISPECIES: hypothetical protein [unclassified Streptomyces]MYZ37920.1 hypothetical protein [Streptomyces sp. SID4917]SCF95167.1 hypothetical protein GA0115259_105478 [Streptomyces sp. MnatMP-M17]
MSTSTDSEDETVTEVEVDLHALALQGDTTFAGLREYLFHIPVMLL